MIVKPLFCWMKVTFLLIWSCFHSFLKTVFACWGTNAPSFSCTWLSNTYIHFWSKSYVWLKQNQWGCNSKIAFSFHVTHVFAHFELFSQTFFLNVFACGSANTLSLSCWILEWYLHRYLSKSCILLEQNQLGCNL